MVYFLLHYTAVGLSGAVFSVRFFVPLAKAKHVPNSPDFHPRGGLWTVDGLTTRPLALVAEWLTVEMSEPDTAVNCGDATG